MDLGASKSSRLKTELGWKRARVVADLDLSHELEVLVMGFVVDLD